MVEVRKLTAPTEDELRGLIAGYVSSAKYRVDKTASEGRWGLTVEVVPLAQPYRKRYDYVDAATVTNYRQMAALGFSFGAYTDGQCVGLALAEPVEWNKSLVVRELHVAATHQRQGVGHHLVDALTELGRGSGFRTLVCETQNTNAPAIAFYGKAGFQLEGIDLTHYRNDDFPDGEIAFLMKKRLIP